MKQFLKLILTILLVTFLAFDVAFVAAILDPDKKIILADWVEDMIACLEKSGVLEESGTLEEIDNPGSMENMPKEVSQEEQTVTETITGEIVTEPSQSELVTYHKLTEEEKHIYNLLRDGIASHAESIVIEPETEEAIVSKCLSCVCMDYPEYYWFDGNTSYWIIDKTDLVSEVEPKYLMTEDEIAQFDPVIEAVVNAVLAEVPAEGSSYEKAKSVYEAVIRNTEYEVGCAYSQSMASVFLQGQSVCAGYAKATQYLLHRIGIPCAYIGGEAVSVLSENGTADSHAWNIAELNGEYYYIDTTWGDIGRNESEEEQIEYGYLCTAPQEFEQTHMAKELPVSMPSCTSADLEYYRMNQMYYEYFDWEEMNQRLIEMTQNGQVTMTFAFATNEAYQQMMTALLEEDLADAAGKVRADMTGADYWKWNYAYNDMLRVVEFHWLE